MAKKLVEVFTSGCPICEGTVKQVKDLTQYSAEHEVVVYDLNKKCDTDECDDKAKEYGVKSVPSVAIDGKLADCCNNNGVNFNTLEAEILGK
ncbi:thioredoxin family protein [Salicibibacter cibarius]|uniref:Glutaredoxin n=2 Tax=Salicibibacter TaxID=2685905 RepID=A0A514LJE4_9BACI|nr:MULTISPECIES: thioredoxin family protein [Salicibibacter]QDI91990.1 glutaredoxin [Salicibibacter halophilus]QQK74525.1 thioredoxin family protein [Salicibibacter cibarius]